MQYKIFEYLKRYNKNNNKRKKIKKNCNLRKRIKI